MSLFALLVIVIFVICEEVVSNMVGFYVAEDIPSLVGLVAEL